jgi:uncharacterized protein (DUF983 family)
MSKQPEWTGPAVSPLQAGLKARCPRCGQGRLYRQMLTPGDNCPVCHLDYSFIDSGDGPAVFVILILGFVILGLALIVESSFHPPLWMQAILWIPTIIVACWWALRFTKALMIALQYKTKARQVAEIEEV